MWMKLPLLGVLLATAFPPAGLAEVYRCQDADGGTRFTDRPCDDTRGLLSFPAGAPAADTSAARMDQTRKLLRAMRQERQEEQERNERELAERTQRARQCHSARDRLAYLQRGGTLYRLDDAGERVVLSDAERESTIARAQRRIVQSCDEG